MIKNIIMRWLIVSFVIMASVSMVKAQNNITLTVNGQSKIITLADTEAAIKLKTLLETSPVTVRMNDYGSFEKVGALPWALPTADCQISTVPGDVMLYQGNNIVIFYGTNSWAYTPLGKIDGASADELKNFLAASYIDAILSVDDKSGIPEITADTTDVPDVHTLQGVKIDMTGKAITELPRGLYIINGEKRLIQ